LFTVTSETMPWPMTEGIMEKAKGNQRRVLEVVDILDILDVVGSTRDEVGKRKSEPV
jgi:hypothetical protein